MSDHILEALKQSTLFKDLPRQELDDIARKLVERKLEEGEVLIRQSEPGESLYIINQGYMKIYTHDKKGEEVIINQCGPGEVIGEMAILDDAPRSASAVALSSVSVMELKRADFYKILDDEPDLAFHIIRDMSSRLRFSTTYLEKVVDWSQRIAAGDYSMAMDQIQDSQTIIDPQASNEARATQLVAAFAKMVQDVKAREDALRMQLQKLTIQIDETKRKQEVEEMSNTAFYKKLREDAARLRKERSEGQ